MIPARTFMGTFQTSAALFFEPTNPVRQYSFQLNQDVGVDAKKNITVGGKSLVIKDLTDIVNLVKHLQDPLLWDEKVDIQQIAPDKNTLKKQFNFPFGLWFRGEKKVYDRPMLPSLYRSDEFYDESSMYAQFVSENTLQYGNSHFSTFEWLTLMQHYGLPTRLLDWSENILTATYFATEGEEPSILYILNALRLNELSAIHGIQTPNLIEKRSENQTEKRSEKWHFLDAVTNDRELSYESHLPVAVLAKKLSDRIRAQFGVFTLHGGKRVWESDKEYPEEIDEKYLLHPLFDLSEKIKPVLTKVHIDQGSKPHIRKQLQWIGINDGSIFPELEHRSLALKNQWTTKVIKKLPKTS